MVYTYWEVGYRYFGAPYNADTEDREIALYVGVYSTKEKALTVLREWAKMKHIKKYKEKIINKDGKLILGEFMTWEGEVTEYDGDWYYAEYMEVDKRELRLDDWESLYLVKQKGGIYDH